MIIKILKQKKQNNAFTLVEMLIYTALMAVITLVIVQSLTVLLKSNRGSFADINLRNSGYSAMEAITREIQASESVEQYSGGILSMRQDNGATTVTFSTSSGGILNLSKNSSVGPVTLKGVRVSSLFFNKIDTGKSTAVRIQMELETDVNNLTKSEWFYGTAVLRGSY